MMPPKIALLNFLENNILRKLVSISLLFLCMQCSFAQNQKPGDSRTSLFQKAKKRLSQIWYEGANDVYIPMYVWHNRFRYSQSRLRTYNENPWGGGLGKGLYDEDGDWHGLYTFVFLDSHKNVEPIGGYAFLKTYHFNENWHIGGGYTVFITARSDIFHNIPFPGILPWAFMTYRRVSLGGTYIPGARDVGNVLFLAAKVLI